MVGVRMGTHNHADVAARCSPQALNVVCIGRAWINHDVAGIRVAHQIAVGPRPGHYAGVGGRQAHQVFEQGHRLRGLPVECMQDLSVGAGECKFAIRCLMLHVACFLGCQPARARA